MLDSKYFTKEDIQDLKKVFKQHLNMENNIVLAEHFGEELLKLTEEEIKLELIKLGVQIPPNLIINKGKNVTIFKINCSNGGGKA